MKTRLKSVAVFSDNAFPLVCARIDEHTTTSIHRHEFYELVVILKGRCRHVTDEGEYPIEAGDVFLLRDNMAHGYEDPERMTIVNIMFDPKRLVLPMDYLLDLPGYHALFQVEPKLRTYNRFRNRLHLPEEKLAEAAAIIARLQQELKRKAPGYRFQACLHLMSLIAFISRCYSLSDRQMDRPLLRMGEVLSYIDQHSTEPIALQQLTRIAHMSERSLRRMFQRVLSRSPIEHILRMRVLKAAEFLRHSDVRVTEAAFECGFSDSNYFSRQFRQIMGVSPRDYRKRHQPVK